MAIVVELFGIPRRRAGVAEVEVRAERLGEALLELGARFPDLAATCLEGDRPRNGYVVNVNGERFTTDPATRLVDGDRVLLLSTDVGG